MDNGKKVVIPGGSGFLGRILAPWFARRGWTAVVLSRGDSVPVNGVRSVKWDGQSLGDWAGELEQAAAVVNLAGRSVNCRYHRRNREKILRSRVASTRILGEAIARCASPPPVWLNSSTATIYKHSLDRAMDEATGQIAANPEAKDAFSIDVATAWERSLDQALTPRTRKIAMRTAMVLASGKGGVFDVLHRLVRLRLGGAMGSGRQFVSWIHGEDFCRAVEWLIAHDEVGGVVNLAAPNPISNRDMMRVLRRLCGAGLGLPATRWMLEVGAVFLRTETELVIKSRRVVPGCLVAAGFQFQFPDIESAFANILRG
jgi:uncharacterized protein (TIGR01777 family)